MAAAVSDEDVISRVLAGDTASFEIIMRRHNQRLYRAARAFRVVLLDQRGKLSTGK